MANNIFRQNPSGRLRSGDLIQKVLGGVSQSVANGFFEKVPTYSMSASGGSFNLTGNTVGLLANRRLQQTSGGSGLATIVRTQHIEAYPFGGAPFTLNITLTAGRFVKITMQGFSTPGTKTCAGVIGNTYTPYGLAQETGGNQAAIQGWYCWNCNGGSETITVSGIPSDVSINVEEYTGVDASANPFIDFKKIDNNAGIPTVTLLTELGCLLVGQWCNESTDLYTGITGASLIAHNVVQYNATFENLSGPATSQVLTIGVSGNSTDNLGLFASFRAATVGGGGGPTFTLTGNPVLFSHGYNVQLAVGGFNLTGNAVLLKKNSKLAISVGNFTLSGNNVGLLRNSKLAIGTGAFNFTGNNILFSRGYVFILSSGNFSFLGNNLVLYKNSKLAAGTGAFNLIGNTIRLLKNSKLSIGNGTFNLTGNDISMRVARRLLVGTGTFNLTGQDLLFLAHRVLNYGTGTFNFTGNDVIMGNNKSMAMNTGSFNFTGNSAALKVARKLLLSVGNFNLTGNNTGLFKNSKMDIALGAFNLTGNDNSMRLARQLAMNSGGFVFVGNDVAITKHSSLNIETGTFVFSGNDALFIYTSGLVYGGTLYKCVAGVLEIADLPDIYNNKNVAGKKLWVVKDGELVLIHTLSW